MLLSQDEFNFWFLPNEDSVVLGYVEVVNAERPLKINNKTYLVVIFSCLYGTTICEFNRPIFVDGYDILKVLTDEKIPDISKFGLKK